MESVAQKLRSGKFLQECGKKLLGAKDVAKRMADPLPDNGGKKRILGDATNRNIGVLRNEKKPLKSNSSIPEPMPVVKEEPEKIDLSKTNSANDSDATLYMTALEDSAMDTTKDVTVNMEDEDKENVFISSKLPPGVEEFDSTCINDIYSASTYAEDIFKYYREKEAHFPMCKYLRLQPDLSKSMRSILVDWMVEVQENFELNHETLYLAVKLMDRFLMAHPTPKAHMQLVSATAIFVAAKFDERLPPSVDDFLYICDDSYSRDEMLQTEIKILKTVDFNLGIPLSYRFLRRYSRCARCSMELLTLARFILETSLMDYDLIDILDSKIAAAALLLALKMKRKTWTPTLQYYSGYEESELREILIQLNKNISGPQNKHLQTIRAKYSHQVFYQVATIPPLVLRVTPRQPCQSLP